ncbi:hypothetical protein SEA_LOZINAK_39 [Gordonia phage Lozinak]|uniref:Minor tail protein n=5 Tax=Smoothievirus TaxID=1982557 RepID=A0A2D1GFP2_9CAUD|nr:neck protein [Gordonia phage Smoothie]YP_009273074.1 neck protein [Gordonia phage ClubL]YP_009276152.1 neck protein [Gordonia phage Bachita]YP_009281195.1 neck protein [Gordonia phage Cucurbita]ATN90665.1 hypothetical protein SEA_LOZINAK_39 [Gordonia phage Lozinak]AUE23676.1 hypothetical protein SEA_TONIANN_39 [Gordonia phage Toniann]QAU06904.1 hypothetical protein SEA_APHELION_39 [Gordonia phage Aphelion]QKY79617.1 hypothetical protein SEA_ENGINEER_40 [Gordonia Phage Engineer]QYC53524.1
MAIRRNHVEFDPEREYVGNALKSIPIKRMLDEKVELGKQLYSKRVVKGRRSRPGQPKNFKSIRGKVGLGGDKKDRWAGEIWTTARHGLPREFGAASEIKRGGGYSKAVAKRYERSTRGRARKRGDAEHVLGGDSRRRTSIVKTLEAQ